MSLEMRLECLRLAVVDGRNPDDVLAAAEAYYRFALSLKDGVDVGSDSNGANALLVGA
jgi:hypothetical protein